MKGLPKTKIVPDLSGPFTKTPRKRTKGQRRYGTKPKRIKAAAERHFQEELKQIRDIGVNDLPSAKSLPPPVLFKPKKEKKDKNRLARLKDKLRGKNGPA